MVICMWKEMAENPNSTSGKDIKKYNPTCLKCDGLDINCETYLKSPDLSSSAHREVKCDTCNNKKYCLIVEKGQQEDISLEVIRCLNFVSDNPYDRLVVEWIRFVGIIEDLMKQIKEEKKTNGL